VALGVGWALHTILFGVASWRGLVPEEALWSLEDDEKNGVTDCGLWIADCRLQAVGEEVEATQGLRARANGPQHVSRGTSAWHLSGPSHRRCFCRNETWS
jgi:hypothetical protein